MNGFTKEQLEAFKDIQSTNIYTSMALMDAARQATKNLAAMPDDMEKATDAAFFAAVERLKASPQYARFYDACLEGDCDDRLFCLFEEDLRKRRMFLRALANPMAKEQQERKNRLDFIPPYGRLKNNAPRIIAPKDYKKWEKRPAAKKAKQ